MYCIICNRLFRGGFCCNLVHLGCSTTDASGPERAEPYDEAAHEFPLAGALGRWLTWLLVAAIKNDRLAYAEPRLRPSRLLRARSLRAEVGFVLSWLDVNHPALRVLSHFDTGLPPLWLSSGERSASMAASLTLWDRDPRGDVSLAGCPGPTGVALAPDRHALSTFVTLHRRVARVLAASDSPLPDDYLGFPALPHAALGDSGPAS